MQKLFVRLNALGQEFAIFEQCIGCNRRGHILCLHLTGDMNSFQRYPVLSCGFFHPRHPVVSKRALIGIIKNEPTLLHRRVLGARLNFGGSASCSNGRYIRLIPHSDVSATANPLYAINLGSERNSRFRPSADRMHSPFLPCPFASCTHCCNSSLAYPCPFREPDTHKQSI